MTSLDRLTYMPGYGPDDQPGDIPSGEVRKLLAELEDSGKTMVAGITLGQTTVKECLSVIFDRNPKFGEETYVGPYKNPSIPGVGVWRPAQP